MDAQIVEVIPQSNARAFSQSTLASLNVEVRHLACKSLSVFEEYPSQQSRGQRVGSQTKRGHNIIKVDFCERVELGGGHSGSMENFKG